MSLFMTLLVRDEEDIVDANMHYHLEQGVDHIIVCDHNSVDDTPDIVLEYVKKGCATYQKQPKGELRQSLWVTQMARMAYGMGAKWVINNDADEFWMPSLGFNLRRWFDQFRWPNIIIVDRHDFITPENDPRPFWQKMIYRKVRSRNSLGQPLPPKAAHRSAKGLVVNAGSHNVAGFRWKRYGKANLDILHFPVRSRDQYIRKIMKGGSDPSSYPTWRKQYLEFSSSGKLQFVDQNILSGDSIKRLIDTGEIEKDTRLCDFLQQRMSSQ